MTDKDDWTNLSERLEALVLKLKLHLEQTGTAEGVPQALGELRERVEDAFTAAGNAVREPCTGPWPRQCGCQPWRA